MTTLFNIGDRVVSTHSEQEFGEGTVVYADNRNELYVDWDSPNNLTYRWIFGRKSYHNVYMFFSDRLQLASEAANNPPLPTDPRLRGICLKIRQLDRKFKQRQEAKRSLSHV